MKNHKEMFEALLAGEELIDNKDHILTLDDTLKFSGNIYNLINPFQYVFHHSDPKNWQIKPKTININGFEVQKPLQEKDLQEGQIYFAVSFSAPSDFYTILTWDSNNVYYRDFLNRGLIHATKEAAELHAKALLSFTSKESLNE